MSTKRIVVAVLLLCISWLSLQQLCAGQTMRCRRNRIISDDAALLSPTHNITAFHDSIPIHPLEDIVTTFWCANSSTGNYVNMTFSQPVVLEGILSSGAISDNGQLRQRHYVSDFAIFYSNTVDGPLQLYSAENFTAMSEIAKYTLIDSLAGLKFQFRINKFQTDVFFCWTLRIFGCTLDSAVHDNPVAACSTTPAVLYTTELPTASSTVQQTSTASSPAATVVTITVLPSCDTVGQQSSQAVAGAIGGGSVVLVVGVVMIVSAIILCIITLTHTRRKRRQSVEVKSRSSTVLKVENVALYTTTISSDIHEEGALTNTLYGDVDTAEAAEYATVDSIKPPPVVTTPNHCYRATNPESK